MLLKNVDRNATYPWHDRVCETRVRGDYLYYHYACDGFDDKGWGCGYRTLQTMCSWVKLNHKPGGAEVPSIPQIQDILVQIEDKPESFRNSRQWIGSVEASYVLSNLYDWDCRILHVASGADLGNSVSTLRNHWAEGGGPVMVGGDVDCSSKCVVGERAGHLLVLTQI
ncbi:ufm1-specific protease 1 [Neocloeon triangulifer]|uniref:ufm1-specific protease 1 n=1 Tax=Neocloeon triangulifer TaxID=2078957 RepID=UPI00286EC510|nr:ufm1-specific protease 1 [Neocloeon triangulifer]